MTLAQLSIVFVACVILHNAEEAVLLPAWSTRNQRWHRRVRPAEFRFAVGMLSGLLIAAAVAAFSQGPQSVAAHVFFGYVFAMAANAVVPHLAASLALRSYMPGTATGVLLNLPLGVCLLHRAVSEKWVETRPLLWVAPMVAFALLASIPFLFRFGRLLFPHAGGHGGKSAAQ